MEFDVCERRAVCVFDHVIGYRRAHTRTISPVALVALALEPRPSCRLYVT